VQVKLILRREAKATVKNPAITGENPEKQGMRKGAGETRMDVYWLGSGELASDIAIYRNYKLNDDGPIGASPNAIA